jgi:hypothetical protein
MPRYQLYLFDDSGRIKESVAFDTGSDAEARSFAEHQDEPRAMELWRGSQVVAQYPARTPQGAA